MKDEPERANEISPSKFEREDFDKLEESDEAEGDSDF